MICLLVGGSYQPGDPPPSGYLELHEWARVQIAGGLKQKKCLWCGLWRFPQEKCCKAKREPFR